MTTESTELAVMPDSAGLVRQASDVAGLCKEIVTRTAVAIQGRKYVNVEGWQSIATAHGCVAGVSLVEKCPGGFRAVADLRRVSNGAVIASAEGFVGEDEPTWFGGTVGTKTLPKRADYAIRAMAQTRAISRVCRSAFAHVVVLMDAGLSTTPAEEVPEGGFNDQHTDQPPPRTAPATSTPASTARKETAVNGWRSFPVPKFIKGYAPGDSLGQMKEKDLSWWCKNYEPKEYRGAIQQADRAFRAALDAASDELSVSGAGRTGTAKPQPTEAQMANQTGGPDEDVPF